MYIVGKIKTKLIALTKKQVRKSCSGLHYIYLKWVKIKKKSEGGEDS
jgi:hypothetical protein